MNITSPVLFNTSLIQYFTGKSLSVLAPVEYNEAEDRWSLSMENLWNSVDGLRNENDTVVFRFKAYISDQPFVQNGYQFQLVSSMIRDRGDGLTVPLPTSTLQLQVVEPCLEMELSTRFSFVLPGGNVTFSLFLSHCNDSSSNAFDVEITFTFPAGEKVVLPTVTANSSHVLEITEGDDGSSTVFFVFERLDRGSYVFADILIHVNDSVSEGTKVNASVVVRYDSSPDDSNSLFPGRTKTLSDEFEPSRVNVLVLTTELNQSYSPSEYTAIGLPVADGHAVSFGEPLLLRSAIRVLQSSYDRLSLIVNISSSDVSVSSQSVVQSVVRVHKTEVAFSNTSYLATTGYDGDGNLLVNLSFIDGFVQGRELVKAAHVTVSLYFDITDDVLNDDSKLRINVWAVSGDRISPTNTVDILLRRPDLLMMLSLDPEEFDAKDNMTLDVRIRHSDSSSVLASNVDIVVSFPDTIDLDAAATVSCDTDMLYVVLDSSLEIDFVNPLFVYGLNGSTAWFNCSLYTRVAQSIHPNESVVVQAATKYRSAPTGRSYSTSAYANGVSYNMKVTSWMEGPSLSHTKKCNRTISATPVSNGEVAFLYLDVMLPESTTNLDYKVNYFLNENNTVTGNNRLCLYESMDNDSDLVGNFTVSAELGKNVMGEYGRSLFSNTSSLQLGELVNIGTGSIDDENSIAITVSVKITGRQAGEVITLQSVLSYDSGHSIQNIYVCQEMIVTLPLLDASMSLDSNTTEAGQVTVINVTIEDRSLVISALRNVSFGLYSTVSLRAVGTLQLHYLDSSRTDVSTSTNYTVGSQQPIDMHCSYFVTVSVPVSVSTDVRYGTLVGVTAVIQYSDYGTGEFNFAVGNNLQTLVPEKLTLELNGTSSYYSYSNNLLVGEELYLMLSALLPSGTGNISISIDVTKPLEISTVGLQFVDALVLSSGDAVKLPNLVAKPAIDDSQLWLTLDEVVTYRDEESSENPLLIKVGLVVQGFIAVGALTTLTLGATLYVDSTSLATSAPIEVYVVHVPKQTIYLSNSSLPATNGANVTLGELVVLRVAIVFSRGRFEAVRINVTLPFTLGEGFMKITETSLPVIGNNIVQSEEGRAQSADQWALFVLGTLTNDATTTLGEDDTVLLEMTAAVPDVQANRNDQYLNVTSLLSYVDPLTKDVVTLPESVAQMKLVDALIALDVQIASRTVRPSGVVHVILKMIMLTPASLRVYDINVTVLICCHVKNISYDNNPSIESLENGLISLTLSFPALDFTNGMKSLDIYGIAPLEEKSILNATARVRYSTSPRGDGESTTGRIKEVANSTVENSYVSVLHVQAELLGCRYLNDQNCAKINRLAPGQMAIYSIVVSIFDHMTGNLTLNVTASTEREDVIMSDLLCVHDMSASGPLGNMVSMMEVSKFSVSFVAIHDDNETVDGREEISNINLTVFILDRGLEEHDPTATIAVSVNVEGLVAKAETDFLIVEPQLESMLSVSPTSFDAGDELLFSLLVQHSTESASYAADVRMTVNLDHINNSRVEQSLHCSHPATSITLLNDILVLFFPILALEGDEAVTPIGVPVTDVSCSFFGIVLNTVRPKETITYTVDVEYSSEHDLYHGVNSSSMNFSCYQSEPISKHYSISNNVSVVLRDLEVRSWVEGPSLLHVKNCGYNISAIPVANGEAFQLYLNVTLPESTTSLNYTLNVLVDGSDANLGLNRSCSYNYGDHRNGLTVDAIYSWKMGRDITVEHGPPLFTNMSSFKLDDVVNVPSGDIDDGDIMNIKWSIKLTGGQGLEAVTLQSVLSYDAGSSVQTIYYCHEITILLPVMEISLSPVDISPIEPGQVIILNATIRDRSLQYSALRNLFFGFYSNVSFRAVGPLQLHYPDTSITNVSSVSNFSLDSQRPLPMYCTDLIMVSLPTLIGPEVRYGTSVALTGTLNYSDYGAGEFYMTADKILQTAVPGDISLYLNGTSSYYSPVNVLVGEKVHLVFSTGLPSGTGNLTANIDILKHSSNNSSNTVALQFVNASILSSGDAVNKPTLMTKTVTNASQLTTVKVTLGEIVTYRETGTADNRLLIGMDVLVVGLLQIEDQVSFSLIPSLDFDGLSLNPGSSLELRVVQLPMQNLYLSDSSLLSTEKNDVTIGEVLTFHVDIVVYRESVGEVVVNITVPSSTEGVLNISKAKETFIGRHISRSGISSVQVSNHWALFMLGNLTNDGLTALSEDDTILLEVVVLVPDVSGNENGQQLNVTSQFFYVDLNSRRDLQIPESVEVLTVVEALLGLTVDITSRTIRPSGDVHFKLRLIPLNPDSLVVFDVNITVLICCQVGVIGSSSNISSVTDQENGITTVVFAVRSLDFTDGVKSIETYGIAPSDEKEIINATASVLFSTTPSQEGTPTLGRVKNVVNSTLQNSFVSLLDVDAELLICRYLDDKVCERSGRLAPAQLAVLSIDVSILDHTTGNLTLDITIDRDDVNTSDVLFVNVDSVTVSGPLRNLVNTIEVDEFVMSLTDVHSGNETEEEVTRVNLTVFLLNNGIVKQNDSLSISVLARLNGQTAKDTTGFLVAKPRLTSTLSVSNSIVDAGDTILFSLIIAHSLDSTSYAADVVMTVNLDHIDKKKVGQSLNCSHPAKDTIQNNQLILQLPGLLLEQTNLPTLNSVPAGNFACSFVGLLLNDVRPGQNITFTLDVVYSSEYNLYDNVVPLILNASDNTVIAVHPLLFTVEADPKHRPWSLSAVSPTDYSVVAVGEPFDFYSQLIIPESTTKIEVYMTLEYCEELTKNCLPINNSSNLTFALLSHNISVGQQLDLALGPNTTVRVTDSDQIQIRLGDVKNQYDNMADFGDNLNISLKVNFSNVLPGHTLRFRAELWYGLDSALAVGYLNILVAQPSLSVTLDRKTTAKESDDILEYDLCLTHASSSTLEAKDIVVVMLSSHDTVIDTLNGSSYYYLSGNPRDITVLSKYDSLGEVVQISGHNHKEQTLCIWFKYSLKEKVRPNTEITIFATVKYGDRGTQRYQMDLSDSFLVDPVTPPTISITQSSVKETTPNYLTTGEMATLELDLILPGSTVNITLGLNITALKHDSLKVINASVLTMADMTISGEEKIEISTNKSEPDSVLWTFPTVVNPSSIDDVNDTIRVQAVIVSAEKDFAKVSDPKVTLSVYTVADNVTIPGSTAVVTLVSPDVTATVDMSLNPDDEAVVDVTATVFHTNISTAIAKNVSLTLTFPHSFDIKWSDIKVFVSPKDLGDLGVNVSKTDVNRVINVDIGDFPLNSTAVVKFSVPRDIASDPVTPIVVYSSVDENDKRLPSFTLFYPGELNIRTTVETGGRSSCLEEVTVITKVIEWTYEIAIIGGSLGFLLAILLTLLIFCFVCRKRRHIPYNIFELRERMSEEQKSRVMAICCCFCCFSNRKSRQERQNEDELDETVVLTPNSTKTYFAGLRRRVSVSDSGVKQPQINAKISSASGFSLQVEDSTGADAITLCQEQSICESSDGSSQLSSSRVAWGGAFEEVGIVRDNRSISPESDTQNETEELGQLIPPIPHSRLPSISDETAAFLKHRFETVPRGRKKVLDSLAPVELRAYSISEEESDLSTVAAMASGTESIEMKESLEMERPDSDSTKPPKFEEVLQVGEKPPDHVHAPMDDTREKLDTSPRLHRKSRGKHVLAVAGVKESVDIVRDGDSSAEPIRESPKLEKPNGFDISTDEESQQQRGGLKVHRSRKNAVASTLGIVQSQANVTVNRSSVATPLSKESLLDKDPPLASPTGRIPGSVGNPLGSGPGSLPPRPDRSESVISRIATADLMRRVSSVTIPELEEDKTRPESAFSLVRRKISGLFSRSSGSYSPAAAAKAMGYLEKRTSRLHSGLTSVGKLEKKTSRLQSNLTPVGKLIAEANVDGRSSSNMLSPALPLESVTIPEWEAIVALLQDDPDKQQLELDSLDVLTSINLDAELEQEKSDIYVQLLVWFIQGLCQMEQITPQQESKLLARLRVLMIELEKKLAKEKTAKAREVAQRLARKHEKQRKEIDVKHYQERFQREMKVEKTEEGIYAPCDGTAYLIGKFKIRITPSSPEVNEGKDIIMTNLLPWKKIDCRGLKIKKDEWIGSHISESKGMMYHKPSTVKRRVTHSVSFEQWRSSITRHQVSNASRVSADYYGSRKKSTKSVGPLHRQSSAMMKEEGHSDGTQIELSPALLEKQQQAEREELEDELRLERDEEDEKLRQMFAAKAVMGIKDIKHKLLNFAAAEVGLNGDNSEKLDGLRDKFTSAVSRLDTAFDEETARVRALLIYRLAKREAIGEALEEQRDHLGELEDLLMNHRDEAVKQAADSGSQDLGGFVEIAEEMTDSLEDKQSCQMAALEDLENRISQENKIRRNVLRDRQKKDLAAFVKAQDEKRLRNPDSAANMVDWLNRRLEFLRKQRQEREQLEATFDEEAGSNISELTDQMSEFIELLVLEQSDKLVAKLISQGISEDRAAAIAECQKTALEQLKKDGRKKLDHHSQHLRDRLEGIEAQAENDRLKELEDRKETRKRVQLIIKNMLDSQLSLSHDERAKYEDDQAAQLVDQESRLTLNKLRQRKLLRKAKILRKAISNKTRQLHRKIDEKRRQDTLMGLVSGNVGDERDTDDKTWRSQKHAIAQALKTKRTSLAEEMFKIQCEVDKERENDVQKHKEQIGAELFADRVSKERNLLKRQEDVNAIQRLQMGLARKGLDDDDSEVHAEQEKIIEEHKEGMERLGTALAKQRERQEEALARRLKKKVERKISRSSSALSRYASRSQLAESPLKPVYEGEELQETK
jgi:hypothetical protein